MGIDHSEAAARGLDSAGRRTAAMQQVQIALRTYYSGLWSALWDQGRPLISIKIYTRGHDWMAVALRESEGKRYVLFATAASPWDAFLALNSSIAANRWREDRPYGKR